VPLRVLLNALPSQVKGYSSKLYFSGAVDPFNFGIQFQYPTKQQEFYGSIRPIHIDFEMKSKPCESKSFSDSKKSQRYDHIDDLQGMDLSEKAISDRWQLSRPCIVNKLNQIRTT
jgi:hypothetical protein